ncbi:MAG: acyltransferase [Crocinitomicaceae bacterium]|nr:acyltransferase [Crocinitomicaceae bacterium]
MKTKLHFKNLDSIRTLAFFSTFLAHSFFTVNDSILTSGTYKNVLIMAKIFGFGVPIFFVLSGFLITFLLMNDFKYNNFSLKRFYTKRVLRIWPLYFLVLIFGFLIFPSLRLFFLKESYIENANYGMYLSFLGNFDQLYIGGEPYGVGLGPTWSVSVEEQFYLFWPLLLWLPMRKMNTKMLVVLLVLLISFCLFTSDYYSLANRNTIPSMVNLAVGSLFGVLSNLNYKKINEKVGRQGWWFLLILICGIFYFANMKFVSWGISRLLFSITTSVFIIYQIYCRSRYDLMRIPLIERLGKYTYGLYMYHCILIFFVFSIFSKSLKWEDSIWSIIVIYPILSLILSVLVSILSYKYFEKPFLRVKNQLK